MEVEKFLKCPNCFSPVKNEDESCPSCKVEFYNCSKCNSIVLESDLICKTCNSNLEENPIRKSETQVFSTAPQYEYKSVEILTTFLLILLIAKMFFSLIIIYADANDISFIRANFNSGGVLYNDELSLNNIFISLSKLFSIVIFITAAIIYFVWVRRSYRNLSTLQKNPIEYSSAWAIGSYFVPILNLFRPYTIMKEIWFGSQPEFSLEDESPDELHERRSSTTFLNIWWAAFLINGIANNFSIRLSFKADTTQKMLTNYWVDIIAMTTGIFLSLIVIYLVLSVKNWQLEKIKVKPTRYCHHCGNEVDSFALLCNHCGKEL